MTSSTDTHLFDPWLDAAAPQSVGASDAAPTGLQIATIENVEPLDAQLGAVVKKTVPDALRDALFGQPEPCPAEIEAAGGDPAAVPPMRTYAILDAAKVVNLPEVLEDSELEHRCLFKGKAYDDLKNVAPWIVRLEDGNTFTRNLFTRSDAYWHLWDNEPGIYVRSRATLDDMWRHFRKFTRVRDEGGQWLYWRFWDSRLYLGGAEQRKWLIGSFYAIFDNASGNKLSICAPSKKGVYVEIKSIRESVRGAAIISRRSMSAWHGLNKIKEISESYGIQYRKDIFERYADDFWKADLDDLEILALLHGYFGGAPKYYFNQDRSAVSQSRKKDFLMRLRFYKAQGIRNGM